MLDRSEFQRRVDAFMEKAGQETPDAPVIPDEETRLLRAKLILEEALETVAALGFSASVVPASPSHLCTLQPTGDPDLTEIADGCCDMMVVTLGTLSACGMSDEALMSEVLDSNDSKFIDGHRRSDGKWMKGPSFRLPRLDEVLISQATEGIA